MDAQRDHVLRLDAPGLLRQIGQRVLVELGESVVGHGEDRGRRPCSGASASWAKRPGIPSRFFPICKIRAGFVLSVNSSCTTRDGIPRPYCGSSSSGFGASLTYSSTSRLLRPFVSFDVSAASAATGTAAAAVAELPVALIRLLEAGIGGHCRGCTVTFARSAVAKSNNRLPRYSRALAASPGPTTRRRPPNRRRPRR